MRLIKYARETEAGPHRLTSGGRRNNIMNELGTILKYPGSKNRIADKIISLFPDDYRKMTYIEPFFGSGTVFFRKAPSVVETINDLDRDVYNLFLQIRNNSEELARLIEGTPWSRQDYEDAYSKTNSDTENARRFLVRFWFAIGAKSYCRTGWRHNIKGNNGNIAAFGQLPFLIKQASYRLRPKTGNVVQIENRDAFFLIEKYNRKEVLMYLDPPYVFSTRKNRRIYTHEMSDEDHMRLCALVNESSAKIILSGYQNDIYENHLKRFKKAEIQTHDEKGNKRMEVIWTNFNTTGNLFDISDLRY
jgi:DNA adenine methylase